MQTKRNICRSVPFIFLFSHCFVICRFFFDINCSGPPPCVARLICHPRAFCSWLLNWIQMAADTHGTGFKNPFMYKTSDSPSPHVSFSWCHFWGPPVRGSPLKTYHFWHIPGCTLFILKEGLSSVIGGKKFEFVYIYIYFIPPRVASRPFIWHQVILDYHSESR